MSVTSRVKFVQDRDGDEAAWKFRDQCVHQYRRAVRTSTRGNMFYLKWLKSYQEAKGIICLDS